MRTLATTWTSLVIWFVCGSLLLMLVASPADAQTLLRWKFKPGQKFALAIEQDTTVQTIVNAPPESASLDMAMDLAWNVLDVDNSGTATMAQSFTRLKLKMTTTSPKTEVTYDSAAPQKPSGAAAQIAAAIKPLLGAKFTVTMDARGEVKEVKLDEAAEKALAELPADSQLKTLLSKEGLADLLRAGGGLLPEKEVSPGDTWEVKNETQTLYGKLSDVTKLTFKGAASAARPTVHTIDLVSTATLRPSLDAPIKLDIKEQTKTGTIQFDGAAGMLSEAHTKLVSKSVRPFRDTLIHVNVSAETKITVKAE